MRAALDAGGRLLRDALWTVRNGRTVALTERAADDPLELVLVPGLVNAHAHLDLGGTPALPPGTSFPEWLLSIGGVRQSERDPAAAAEAEASSLASSGVVAVGDIDGSDGAGTRGRRRAGLGGRTYLEIVGVDARVARARLARTLHLADRLGQACGSLGLSPHAPYSVSSEVLPEIVRAAAARRLPLAMHLAESEEETRFLAHGDGPFRPFLDAIGRGDPFPRPPGLRPVAWAERTGFLEAGGVVIHGNDLDDDDVDCLVRHRSSVVYCHGTHRHFARPPHRLQQLVAAGVNLAFGTDSSASNEGIDLFAELGRLVRDRPDIDPSMVLAAATLGGRRALRLPEEPAGFLPGSSADGLLLGPLPDDDALRSAGALAAWIFGGGAHPRHTIVSGRVEARGHASPEGRRVQLDSLHPQG